jgi:nicotinamidase/pyrazinamidase
VRATSLDAVDFGYQVVLIKNLCRGVAPDTSQKALDEMKAEGVVIRDDLDLEKLTSGEGLKELLGASPNAPSR